MFRSGPQRAPSLQHSDARPSAAQAGGSEEWGIRVSWEVPRPPCISKRARPEAPGAISCHPGPCPLPAFGAHTVTSTCWTEMGKSRSRAS